MEEIQEEIKEFKKNQLKNLFLNSEELKNMLNTAPEGVNEKALASWNEHGPISIETIIENSNMDDIEEEVEELEFKRVDKV